MRAAGSGWAWAWAWAVWGWLSEEWGVRLLEKKRLFVP